MENKIKQDKLNYLHLLQRSPKKHFQKEILLEREEF